MKKISAWARAHPRVVRLLEFIVWVFADFCILFWYYQYENIDAAVVDQLFELPEGGFLILLSSFVGLIFGRFLKIYID